MAGPSWARDFEVLSPPDLADQVRDWGGGSAGRAHADKEHQGRCRRTSRASRTPSPIKLTKSFQGAGPVLRAGLAPMSGS